MCPVTLNLQFCYETVPLKLRFSISRFFKDDQAAVTVDWVVLTASVVFIGLTIVTIVISTLGSNATTIADEITSVVSAGLS